MRTSVFVGTSLDGFIARSNGAFDFLSAAEGEPHGFHEFMATVDAIVMGRNTYETVLPFSVWPYGEKPVFVLSTRPLLRALGGVVVEHMDATPSEVLSRLAARGFEHVYVDGGVTIQSFLRAGLIDRLIVTRVPVLIGSGIPLFGPVDADIPVQHVATSHLASGAVQSEYTINVPRIRTIRRKPDSETTGLTGA
ncbi:MAG: dihydrofolate reductase family protein [Acidobacteriota bacterium]